MQKNKQTRIEFSIGPPIRMHGSGTINFSEMWRKDQYGGEGEYHSFSKVCSVEIVHPFLYDVVENKSDVYCSTSRLHNF